MSDLILYGTEGCHLCDDAQQVLNRLGILEQVSLLDIALQDNSEDLIAQYGEKIPVLLDTPSQQTLCWPFDEASVLNWLKLHYEFI
ncbi:glutaredoxin family protein [Catenovulum sp. 2E275]|uniref:glutaredoxin family protein n=1 Tax=Catenovulum sp. 2E275 TaxID=2980497 RepID=UPI0021CE0526|nr:glutaredoxin family protein [Catenovulum sp. 2E275]MCU4674451.1 glutaredoxin family protein [Catenovulum sp. 2E275]